MPAACTENSAPAGSQFVLRFVSLPVVTSAFDLAAHTYGRVKQAAPILDYTLTTAEKSVLYANDKAKPFVKRFESQIAIADGLACKGLVKLEEKVPIITKPTEMIIQDTKSLYTNTIKMGVDKYENAKNFGTAKVNAVRQYGLDTASGLLTSQYGKLVTESVDGALSLTENCIDHFLPALDDEKIVDAKQPITDRVTNLSSKLQRRVYRHAIYKASNLKQTAENSLTKYTSSEVVKSTQANLNKAVENARINATWIWETLNAEPEVLDNQTLPQRALNNARFTTRHVVSVFVTAKTTVQSLPTRVNDGLTTVSTFSSNAYQKVQPQELATLVFQIRDSLRLEERVNLIVRGISQTVSLQWLIHSMFPNADSETESSLE